MSKYIMMVALVGLVWITGFASGAARTSAATVVPDLQYHLYQERLRCAMEGWNSASIYCGREECGKWMMESYDRDIAFYQKALDDHKKGKKQ